MIPQTVFRPGETLHNLALSPLPEKDCVMPKLFAPSDLLQGMALDDEPNQSPWGVSSGPQAMYEGPRCVELAESDTTSSPWADDTAGEKTVSPQMLRLRHTPSPTSSSESLHTSFLADANANHSPIAFEQMPSPRRPRKLLPDHGRPLVPTNSMARYQPVVRSAPTSPRRRLVGFRPHARSVPTPSPPPPSMPAFSPGADGRQEIADRMAKNDFLVRQRQMGMSYKEIRRAGGFTEAESTLRGRYRTLTKSREARVRRPEWCEKDVSCPWLFLVTFTSALPALFPSSLFVTFPFCIDYHFSFCVACHFSFFLVALLSPFTAQNKLEARPNLTVICTAPPPRKSSPPARPRSRPQPVQDPLEACGRIHCRTRRVLPLWQLDLPQAVGRDDAVVEAGGG